MVWRRRPAEAEWRGWPDQAALWRRLGAGRGVAAAGVVAVVAAAGTAGAPDAADAAEALRFMKGESIVSFAGRFENLVGRLQAVSHTVDGTTQMWVFTNSLPESTV